MSSVELGLYFMLLLIMFVIFYSLCKPWSKCQRNQLKTDCQSCFTVCEAYETLNCSKNRYFRSNLTYFRQCLNRKLTTKSLLNGQHCSLEKTRRRLLRMAKVSRDIKNEKIESLRSFYVCISTSKTSKQKISKFFILFS